MTPNVFFLQLALFTMGNSAVNAFAHRRISKRQSLISDFVFPDQIEIVSESPTLNVRQAPFIMSYENQQRSFSRDDSMQWDLDDGHQYRTQFTLRRAKPFGETKARKPLSIAGEKKQGRGSSISSDESANVLTTQASSQSCHHHHPTQPSRRPAGYSSTTSSAPPPIQYSNQVNEFNNSQSHFRNDKDVIQTVKTTDSVNHNIAYYSPSKTYNAEISSSSSGEGTKFPYTNPIPHMIRPMATLTNSVSDSPDTGSLFPRPITSSTNTGAVNYRPENRTSGSYVSKSFDQTHSTSVITAVDPKPTQLGTSNEPSKRPPESQSSSSASSAVGSRLYFGSSETYAFRSSFAANSPSVGEDVSGDDFFLSFQDLVKYPFLGKLYNPDLYNTQYKTLFRSSSSSSSQSASSGTSRSGSSFPRDFPVFPTFTQSSGPYLGSAGKGYFFKR